MHEYQLVSGTIKDKLTDAVGLRILHRLKLSTEGYANAETYGS